MNILDLHVALTTDPDSISEFTVIPGIKKLCFLIIAIHSNSLKA